jgi:hypothetical protein
MPMRFLGLPRIAAVAIVLAAAALMLLRPLCESWHGDTSPHASTLDRVTATQAAAHSDGASSDACCSSSDIGVVSAVRTASFDRDSGSSSIAPPFAPAALVVLSIAAHAIVRRRPPARTPQSYYLRSVRILR